MSKLIEMPGKKGNITVEVETPEGEIVPVGKKGEWLAEKVEQNFDKVKEVILNSCDVLTGALKDLAEKESALESASLEFGIKFTGEGKAFLVKTAAEGSIRVSIALKLNQPKM